MMGKVILCIGTLDSKGPELDYVRKLIERKGYRALVMDISSLEGSAFAADITAGQVAAAAGTTIDEVRHLKEAGPAARIMTAGAIRLAKEMYREDKFDAVISVGGGTGSSVSSGVMRELPIGLPKFMLASQKIVQAGIRRYVGTRDIAVLPSLADIAGLNRLTRDALNKAVGAVVGMMESAAPETSEKPLVFMTMTGLSTGCGLRVKSRLEERGCEVAVFHAIGVGGETFEEMVGSYPVCGVIELGLNEIGNELFGGMASAGPHRLETAGSKGVPQVVTPGCIDIINFLAPETVPDKYRDRPICYHNTQATLPRLNADELRLVGRTMAEKLNKASGPVRVLIPVKGCSSLDCPGNVCYDPAADRAFVEAIRASLNRNIELKQVDAAINDAAFADAVFEECSEIVVL